MPPDTRSQQADALFSQLLSGDGQPALDLARGGGEQLRQAGPAGLTTLHAAVLGRCGGATLAALAAAGVPLEAALDDSVMAVLRGTPLGQLLVGKCGWAHLVLYSGATALSLASAFDVDAVAHLLQLGADPLGPSVSHFRSTMCHAALLCTQAVADAFLAYFEGQRAAGGLCGMSAQRAMLLLEVVAMLGHASLAAHAAAELERACEGPAGQGGMLDEDALQRLIVGAARSTHDAAADMLRELLRSRLPFELAPPSPTYVPLLAVAVEGGPVEEKSRVLHAAGAPLTAQALLHAIEAAGRCTGADALRTVEALLAAGYRPTVWHNVPVPGLLRGAVPQGSQVLQRLDPFDFYPAGLNEGVLLVARGGRWSPGTHRLWPPAFKDAARTLLLASAHSSQLEALPADAVLRVVQLTAVPMSGWVGADAAGWYSGRTASRVAATLVAGALIGVTACGLQWGIEHGVAARNSALQHASVHNGALGVFVAKIFLSTCLTAVAGVLVLLFAPLAAGGGVSAVMGALNGSDVPGLLDLDVFAVKATGGVLSSMAALAVGVEGPMVHLGACVASGMCRAEQGLWEWGQAWRAHKRAPTPSATAGAAGYEALPAGDNGAELFKDDEGGEEGQEGGASPGSPADACRVDIGAGRRGGGGGGADSEEEEKAELAAAGSQGAAAQVDHSVFHREMVSAGVAAGIAGAFGAPLGGVLYALEEACSHWSRAVAWRCFLCAAMATFVHAQLSPSSDMGILALHGAATLTPHQWLAHLPLVVAVSAGAGAIGASLTRLRRWVRRVHPPTRSPTRSLADALAVAALKAVTFAAASAVTGSCRPLPAHWRQEDTVQHWCIEGEYHDAATLFWGSSVFAIKSIIGLGSASEPMQPQCLASPLSHCYFGAPSHCWCTGQRLSFFHLPCGNPHRGHAGVSQALGIIIAAVVSNYVAHLCGADSPYHDDLAATDGLNFLQSSAWTPSCLWQLSRRPCRRRGTTGSRCTVRDPATGLGRLDGFILRSQLLVLLRHRAYCDAQGRYLHVPAAAAPQLEQRLSLLMQERTRRTSSGRMLLVFNGDASSEPSPGPSPRHTPGLASPRNSDASLAPAGSSSSGALWQQWGASPVTWQSFAQPPQPQPQPQAEEAAAAAGVRRRSRREQEEGGAHLNLQPFMNRAPSQCAASRPPPECTTCSGLCRCTSCASSTAATPLWESSREWIWCGQGRCSLAAAAAAAAAAGTGRLIEFN
ncbi:chloride Carrier Channel family isoform A [Micractinium conductrix]|uniref:Chloride Carrier Channel family isoform A n=1 Tax=Micractinium conductrix TaxID=554055 RepID=A0A2P6VPN1_9CHLO|nr:chloride Carrier Channel family isoform A [Micractinium conductrix]|eukprot:PSC76029.1 chloride Carrier Channel family isoform A [Micractinium conductrix]